MVSHFFMTCIIFLLLPRPLQSSRRINKSKSCHWCDEEMTSCMQRRRYPFQALVCVERKKGCMRGCSVMDIPNEGDKRNGKNDIEIYIDDEYWNFDQQIDNVMPFGR